MRPPTAAARQLPGALPAGPGHSVAEGLDIPGAGTWTVLVTARFDEFTATSARTPVAVR